MVLVKGASSWILDVPFVVRLVFLCPRYCAESSFPEREVLLSGKTFPGSFARLVDIAALNSSYLF